MDFGIEKRILRADGRIIPVDLLVLTIGQCQYGPLRVMEKPLVNVCIQGSSWVSG